VHDYCTKKQIQMLDGLMKQFEETQKKMNEQLAAEVIEVQDSSKQITIKVDGNNTLLDLSIDEVTSCQEA